MAATDATPFPVKNQAFRVTFPILDNTGSLVSGAAALDSEVSKDAGAFADVTAEATEIATSSGVYYLDLTATEMNADTVVVIVKTTTTDAKTTTLVMYPQTDGLDRTVDVTHWNGTAVATPTTAGVPEVDVTYFAGGVLPTPAQTGVPDVNTTYWADNATTASAGNPDVNIESIDASAITATSIATGAITNAKVAAGALTAVEITGAAGCAVSSVGTNVITATSIQADAIGASELAADAVAEIADAVWDELQSDHQVDDSFGLANNKADAGTASAGGATTITLDTTASAVADIYNGMYVTIVGGTGVGQSRLIVDYAVTTKQATVEPAWITNPASGSKYYLSHGGNVDLRTASQTTLDAASTLVATDIVSDGTAINTTAGVVDSVTATADVTNLSNLPTIPTDWITADGIAASAIGATEIATDAITAAKIAAGAITSSEFTALNATALGNLEDQYDGTGLSGDDFPAKQSQVTGIANVGAATHKQFTGETLTTPVTATSGSYSDTEELDGTYLDFSTVSGGMDVELTTNLGSGVPQSLEVSGYLQGGNDSIRVQAYDYTASSFKTVGSINGSNSSTNQKFVFTLFTQYVGTGANLGNVRIRFYNDNGTIDTALTSANFKVDQAFIAFSQGSEGYSNGAVWFDSTASNTGTITGVDGVASNPVSTVTALKSILSNLGLKKVEVYPGSTLTLDADFEGYDVNGNGAVLALGTQNIGGSVFSRFGSVSGVATTTGSAVFFEDCLFGTTTLIPCVAQQCGFGDTVTQNGAGDYTFVDCYSTVAGSGAPTFNRTGLGTMTAEYRRFSGGLTQSGVTSSDTLTIGGELGTVTLNGADGTTEIRGIYKTVTDNRTGSPTLNIAGAIQGGDVASILADTADMQPKLGTPAGTDMSADIADIPTVSEFELRTPTAAELLYITDNAATAVPVTFTAGTTTTAYIRERRRRSC